MYAEAQNLSDIFPIMIASLYGYAIGKTMDLPIGEDGWEDARKVQLACRGVAIPDRLEIMA